MNIDNLLPDVNRDKKDKDKKLSESEAFIIESLEASDYATSETLSKVSEVEKIIKDRYEYEDKKVIGEKNMTVSDFQNHVLSDSYKIEQRLENMSNEIYEILGLIEFLIFVNFSTLLFGLLFLFL